MENTYLMIDDDRDLTDLMRQYLQGFNIRLEIALTPSEGLKRLQSPGIDLVILDVMLPEMDGFEVCRRIRETSSLPILMLTARGELTDKVLGLEIGCDDYLPKPFEPRELVARCQSLVRRSQKLSQATAEASTSSSAVQLDLPRLKAHRKGKSIDLSGMEADALAYLMDHQGEVVSRDALLNQLKGHDAEVFSRSIDILISRLRAKLRQLTEQPLIYTLRGKGYRFWEDLENE